MAIETGSTSNDTTVNGSSAINEELNSPLYMHPSDNPGASLVQVPFDGVGYRSWKRSVLRVLSVKNKLGFINGDCRRPNPGTPRFRQWGRCDDMVTSWILNSLSKEIAESVEYVSDSFELWKELEDRYDQTNGAKLYQVQREINELSQGTLDITTYYTKMKRLWEELNTLHVKTQCNCNCTCGAKDNMFKVDQDRKLIQFLMGLNEVYTVIRGNILMMNPLPSLAQTFSLLIQDEKQREIKPNTQMFMESTSLYVKGAGKKITESVNFSGNSSAGASTSRSMKPNHPSTDNSNFRTNYSQTSSYNGNNRPRMICDYCKRPGHTRDRCYKLHGYPQMSNQNPSRLNKGKGLMVDTQGENCSGEENHKGNHNDASHQLTKEQYVQFMEMLQQFQAGKDNTQQHNDFSGGAVNSAFAGSYEQRTSISEWEHCAIKKTKTEKSTRGMEHLPRGSVSLDRPKIINVQDYRLFVSTWNVGGESPLSNLNLDEWLHSSPPADIYVLGFQEIVPLNAGNILGAEDSGPAKKWIALIGETLNSGPGTSGGYGCYTSSPVPIAEWNADFEGSNRYKTSSFSHRRSVQTPQCGSMENDPSISQLCVDGRYSVCDRVIFGHRSSDFDPNREQKPSDFSSSRRPSDYTSFHRPSDYSSGHRPSDYSCGQRPSDVSRWGSSDDEYGPGDSPTDSFSPVTNRGYAPAEDGCRMPRNSTYCLAASKQMVGIFLTIWVRGDLREHVRNLKVSCVGRGLMGYLRNKGSISMSMQLHQTSFCFVCTHLTSGQKEGDELRRNSDVMEILKKTRFPQVSRVDEEKSPETILEHDRVIWLGDLNYRIALSYRSAKALVEMQNWRALLGNDQLRLEQRRGRVFEGWKEGKIYFPPTYKYSRNSDRYSVDDMQPKDKRRTPAWCDRILWHGGGLQQLSYVRGESRFSDHRPVFSMFLAEVESEHIRLRKVRRSSSRIEVEELLPYSHGYTELCFF